MAVCNLRTDDYNNGGSLLGEMLIVTLHIAGVLRARPREGAADPDQR